MEAIFHEKICHYITAQYDQLVSEIVMPVGPYLDPKGEYFTAVDLAALAHNLDDVERQHMAEGGLHREEYKNFIQQPSANMDDSGYFSVQVIASALKVWNLELIPFNSQHPTALMAKVSPVTQAAFICNYKDHWFTVRKLGLQWFNLNSLLTGPDLISDTYLVLFLTQLEQEGYSIFIVIGDLPECEADNLLKLARVVQVIKPVLLSEARAQKNAQTAAASAGSEQVASEQDLIEEEQLQEALRLSLQEDTPSKPEPDTEASSSKTQAQSAVDTEALRHLRLNYFQNKAVTVSNVKQEVTESTTANGADMTEEEMLDAAIKMSMDPS